LVSRMRMVYAAHPERETIGIVAPRYREESSGLLHDELPQDSAESHFVGSTMMSGNLVRTDVIERVGFYNEHFFIDYVDHEFCLRMAQHGFRVLRLRDAVLDHNLGHMSTKRVAGITFATTNHSPLRRYYNARNRTAVYRSYGRVAPGWVASDLRSFLVETAKILLLEQDRGAKLVSVARGVWDGLLGASPPVPGPRGAVGASR
jgi:rhamnosyltransferase